MDRVVVLGRGGAGKSVLARRLAAALGAPCVELDALFWRDPDLRPLDPAQWARVQAAALPAGGRWVADGDLGPYDAPAVRLARADTVVLLDLGLARCAVRALRRGRERRDFWWWVLTYRVRWRPRVLAAVRAHAPHVEPVVLRGPRAVRRWLGSVGA